MASARRMGVSGWSLMLMRLPYLAVTSVFAFIRLLPTSTVDKDIEILTLRHQLAVLQTARHPSGPRFSGRAPPPAPQAEAAAAGI